MRAISLWQPFASLVELGAKTYETRGWPCDCIGQLVAIHAALKKDRACMATAKTKPFRPVLKPHYYQRHCEQHAARCDEVSREEANGGLSV